MKIRHVQVELRIVNGGVTTWIAETFTGTPYPQNLSGRLERGLVEIRCRDGVIGWGGKDKSRVAGRSGMRVARQKSATGLTPFGHEVLVSNGMEKDIAGGANVCI